MSHRNRPRVPVPHRQTGSMAISQEYHGPLPLPAHLEHYERILTGAADRIITMAENQASHRQKLEAKVIDSDIKNSLWGLIFAFIIGLGGVIGGFYLISIGKAIEGSLYGGGTMVALTGVFIYGSKQRQKERESKIQ